MGFHTVEGFEKLEDGFGVRFFGSGEAGAVDTIVDVRVNPLVCRFDLLLEIFRVEDYVLVFLWKKIVELSRIRQHRSWYKVVPSPPRYTYLRIKHSNDLRALVRHNLPLFGIIQCRHRKASLILWIHAEVDVPQELISKRICSDIFARRILVLRCRKSPSFVLHVPMYAGEGDDIFEAFEFANYECSMGPRACIRDLRGVSGVGLSWCGVMYIEMITASFWRKFAAFFDEISELRLTSLELAGLVTRRDPIRDLSFSLQFH